MAPAGLLSEYGTRVPAGWLGTLEQNLAAAPNTRSGYFAALAPAVAFMDNPTVARACRPGAGEGFDPVSPRMRTWLMSRTGRRS